MKENIDDWNPGYYDHKKKVWIPYDKAWFCPENVITHHNEKAVLSCPQCSKKYYREP